MRQANRYKARFAASPDDIRAAQALRHLAFVETRGGAGRKEGLDRDSFDYICRHVLIEETATGDLVATFRFLPLKCGGEVTRSYSAQYYDLGALERFDRPMVELGRFCVAPGLRDPDVLRTAWGAMTAFVDQEGVALLFGCSSFEGTDASAYADAFAMLREGHLAPKRFWPKVKAPDVFRFARRFRRKPDMSNALRTMPPLLRSYLTMGGWVSDHAVIDRDLNTLHVFTGLEIGNIPAARARALRAMAG